MDERDIICWLNKEHVVDFIHIITRNNDRNDAAAVQDMIVLDVYDEVPVLRWK